MAVEIIEFRMTQQHKDILKQISDLNLLIQKLRGHIQREEKERDELIEKLERLKW